MAPVPRSASKSSSLGMDISTVEGNSPGPPVVPAASQGSALVKRLAKGWRFADIGRVCRQQEQGMSIYSGPVFEMAARQFGVIADYLDIPLDQRDRLLLPKRAVTV